VAFVDPSNRGSFVDWRAVAAWYAGLAAPACDAGQAPPDLLARSVRGAPEAAVRTLAGEVERAVNYAAIELGDRAWVPDKALDTWTRRYGDCKDMSTLLVAALTARGVVARPALTCTRGEGSVDPSAPDPGQFNHCIVALLWPGAVPPASISARGPSGRTWTFFDPTAADLPFGLLPLADAGAWAVIADTAEGLVRLPAPAEYGFANHAVAHLEDDGTLVGVDTLTADGQAGAWIRAQIGGTDDAQRRARVARLFETSWGTPEVTGVAALPADSARFATSLAVTFRLAGAAQRVGRSWVVRPLFLMGERTALPADTLRTLPYVLNGPARYTDRFELVTPSGYAAEAVPAIAWSGAVGEYRLDEEAGPGRVAFTRRLVLRADRVPAADYAAVRRLKSVVYAGDTAAFVLRRGD
jgi:hypothetical protein